MGKKNLSTNQYLLIYTFILLFFGFVVLSSASSVESLGHFGNTYHFILRQILFGGFLGICGMYVCSQINYHRWKNFLPFAIFISLLFLVLVKVPGIGISAGGASRWLALGPLVFQPAELAKLVLIIYLATWVEKKKTHLNNFYFGLLPSLLIVILYAGLILSQPDMGTMLVVLLIAISVLFAGGISLKYFFWSGVTVLVGLYFFIKTAPYRMRRVITFLNPELDPKGIGYHINQAFLAISSGGIFGYGYGLSRQKHSYLPEVMTDSIFAILGEELGFVGVLSALILFWFFVKTALKISRNAPDIFGKLFAFGITSWLGFQTIINISAMSGLLPLTGIPLPFFSYGSTALLLNLCCVGILYNIGKNS